MFFNILLEYTVTSFHMHMKYSIPTWNKMYFFLLEHFNSLLSYFILFQYVYIHNATFLAVLFVSFQLQCFSCFYIQLWKLPRRHTACLHFTVNLWLKSANARSKSMPSSPCVIKLSPSSNLPSLCLMPQGQICFLCLKCPLCLLEKTHSNLTQIDSGLEG